MTKKDKLLSKFLKNPQSLKYTEVERILLDLKFIKMSGKGSHVKFLNPFLGLNLTIPVHNNECKSIYKIKAFKLVNNFISNENDNGLL